MTELSRDAIYKLTYSLGEEVVNKLLELEDRIEEGTGGSLFLGGTTDPTDDEGVEGSMYLNTVTGDLYEKKSGIWEPLMNIKNEVNDIEIPDINHDHDDLYYRKEDIDNSIGLVSRSLYTVKVSEEDEPSYLSNKIDNITLTLEGKELKVRHVDGLTVGVADISEWLAGTSGNIQTQIDGINNSLVSLTSGMTYIGKVETHADLESVGNKNNGNLIVVLADESQSGGRSMYVYSEDKGMWDFIGEFTFSDEFIDLKDTPSSYEGADGKVVKVAGERIVFSDVDYADLANKPKSTITDIDDAVEKKHEHHNEDSLARLGVNEDGELTINGSVYVPKETQQSKQYLYARRVGTDQTLTAGADCIFNSKRGGVGIPYNTSTGVFTLEAGKTYRVMVTASMYAEGFVMLSLVHASNNSVTPDGNQAIWMSVSPSTAWKESSAGPLVAYVTPTTTQGFKIRTVNLSGLTRLRFRYSALEVTEV